MAGASCEEKGHRGPQLRAGSHKADVHMACQPDSLGVQGIPVAELINTHQLGLISWFEGEEEVVSSVSTYVRSWCQGRTGLPTQVQSC